VHNSEPFSASIALSPSASLVISTNEKTALASGVDVHREHLAEGLEHPSEIADVDSGSHFRFVQATSAALDQLIGIVLSTPPSLRSDTVTLTFDSPSEAAALARPINQWEKTACWYYSAISLLQ
jgi:hypothetical protein